MYKPLSCNSATRGESAFPETRTSKPNPQTESFSLEAPSLGMMMGCRFFPAGTCPVSCLVIRAGGLFFSSRWASLQLQVAELYYPSKRGEQAGSAEPAESSRLRGWATSSGRSIQAFRSDCRIREVAGMLPRSRDHSLHSRSDLQPWSHA